MNSRQLNFSYRDFKDEDLIYDGFIPLKEMKRLDYVDLTQYSSDKVHEYLQNLYNDYESNENIYNGKYFYKEFVIREQCENVGLPSDEEKFKKEIRYWRFCISDWDEDDKELGIDSRTLTMDIYTLQSTALGNRFVTDGSYRIKITYLNDILKRLGEYLDIIEDCNSKYIKISKDIINMYILPIFVCYDMTNSNKQNVYPETGKLYSGYKRISDWSIDWDNKTYDDELTCIAAALTRFAVINYHMVKSSSENKYVKVDNDKETDFRSAIHYYSKSAKSDKPVIINIDGIKHVISKNRNNIYDGNIVRKICDYKFQVSGHWRHLKSGKVVWVNSYYKNKDKEFKVIKNNKLEVNN